jgi:FAD/FMN-containing dehydrogenase
MPTIDILGRTGETVHVPERALTELDANLEGEVVRPDDGRFDELRRVWNGLIDPHPAALVRCATTADVVAAVGLARDHDLRLSVRGGGHNVAGNGVADGGLVVDLADMRTVTVDPVAATAHAQGGATIGDVDAATQPYGLAVPLGLVSETGVAGLTLGGGFSWLRGAHGLACDNLIAAEIVTADGRVVTASEIENPDLLWGLRGGGGNFGVATLLSYRAHAVGPEVFFSVVFHADEDSASALRFFRDWSRRTSDAISAIAVLWHAPAVDDIPAEHHGRAVTVFAAMHVGTPAMGAAELASLRSFGTPIADWSQPMPYMKVQRFFDEDYPKWLKRYYWKSAYLSDLADPLIDRIVTLNRDAPSHETNIDVWQVSGAASRTIAGATAFGDRSAPFLLNIEANWDEPTDDGVNIAWSREVLGVAAPWSTGGRYMNFSGLHEDDTEAVPATFGANLERLTRLKASYDPTNLFRFNHNIVPTVTSTS